MDIENQMAQELTPLSKVKLKPSDKMLMLDNLRKRMDTETISDLPRPELRRKKRNPWLRGALLSAGTVAAVVGVVAVLSVTDLTPNKPNAPIGIPGVVTTAYAYTVVAPSHFNAIEMTSSTYGWGTGYDSSGHFQLIKTTDGGVGWNKIKLPVSPPTYDVSTNQIGQPGYVEADFLNGSDGWLSWINSQQQMTVMKTMDGGQHWQVFHTNVPMYAQTVSNVDFVNATNGWILATSTAGMGQEQKFLFHTMDGGKTWSKVSETTPPNGQLPIVGTSAQISFESNGKTGWLATGNPDGSNIALFRTTSAGTNWTQKQLPVPSEFDQNANPVSSTVPIFKGPTGSFTVEFSKLQNGADVNYLVIYNSSDAGKTWTPTVVKSLTNVPPTAISMGVRNGWLVRQGVVYRTADGGRTWSKISTLSNADLGKYPVLSDVTFVDSNTGWILVQSQDFQHSKLLKTTNSGQTWQNQ